MVAPAAWKKQPVSAVDWEMAFAKAPAPLGERLLDKACVPAYMTEIAGFGGMVTVQH